MKCSFYSLQLTEKYGIKIWRVPWHKKNQVQIQPLTLSVYVTDFWQVIAFLGYNILFYTMEIVI